MKSYNGLGMLKFHINRISGRALELHVEDKQL